MLSFFTAVAVLFMLLVDGAVLVRGRVDAVAAFATTTRQQRQQQNVFVTRTTTTTTTQLRMQPEFVDMVAYNMNIHNNMFWLATVDSDIAKLSDNEFAPVFLGGIMVMVGGVLSAVIVGFILEQRNLYANVVADSYAQQQDPNQPGFTGDEAFWKGLSEEEKKKTQDALQRLRQSKQQQQQTNVARPAVAATPAVVAEIADTSTSTASTSARAVVVESQSTSSPSGTAAASKPEKLDMFSDYTDS